MDPAIVTRTLHVLGVVLWIGGVAFVTTVLLPSVRRLKSPAERVAFFEAIEGRFAWQARVTTVLVGAFASTALAEDPSPRMPSPIEPGRTVPTPKPGQEARDQAKAASARAEKRGRPQ